MLEDGEVYLMLIHDGKCRLIRLFHMSDGQSWLCCFTSGMIVTILAGIAARSRRTATDLACSHDTETVTEFLRRDVISRMPSLETVTWVHDLLCKF